MDLIKQGDQAFKDGQYQITTGIFKWTKDYNSAFIYFDEAAKSYKQAQEWNKSILALEQCKICNENLNDIWGTARNIEAMINILIDHVESKEFQKIHSLALEASILFKADQHDECIKIKQKVAKYFIKNEVIEQAQELLESAIQDAEESSRTYIKKEVFENYLEVLVELGQYSKAITIIKKQFTNPQDAKNTFQSPSNGLCIVILCLLSDEPLRAEQEFKYLLQIIPALYCSKQYEVCEELIKAYNDRNQEEFTKQAQKPSVTNLYPTIIPRLLNKKKIKAGYKKQIKQSGDQQNDQNNLIGQNNQQQYDFDSQLQEGFINGDDPNAIL